MELGVRSQKGARGEPRRAVGRKSRRAPGGPFRARVSAPDLSRSVGPHSSRRARIPTLGLGGFYIDAASTARLKSGAVAPESLPRLVRAEIFALPHAGLSTHALLAPHS
jgi:hypothetical protein